MPVSAAIKFTQGVTTDIAGRAVIGATAVAVVMTNGDNSDAFDWTWELLTKPSASAIASGVIAAGAVISASFMPDVPGSYLARLTVMDTMGNQAQDTRAFIVREGSGRIIPPFRGDSGSLNYAGQDEGWDPAMEQWLHATDGRAPRINAGTGTLNDVVSADLVDGTAADGLRFTNAVGPTITGLAAGYSGRRLYVLATVSAVVLANENLSSAAANRIVTGAGMDVTLQAGSVAWLVYDGVDLRWRLQPIGVLVSPTITGTVTYQGTHQRILNIPGEVQTADATVTTLAFFLMSDETLCAFDVIITAARRVNVTKGGRWKRSVVYRRTGAGVATIVGVLESGVDEETDAGLDVTITAVGSLVLVNVTGLPATNFNWTCDLRVQETNAT